MAIIMGHYNHDMTIPHSIEITLIHKKCFSSPPPPPLHIQSLPSPEVDRLNNNPAAPDYDLNYKPFGHR